MARVILGGRSCRPDHRRIGGRSQFGTDLLECPCRATIRHVDARHHFGNTKVCLCEATQDCSQVGEHT